jgi:KaiC/GvpD/RAD55 family RecA-like ATPase
MSLNRIALEELPEKSVLLVEEDIGDIKGIFSKMIVADGLRSGKKVLLASPGSNDEIIQQLSGYRIKDFNKLDIVEKFFEHSKIIEICNSDVNIFENFTLPFIDADIKDLFNVMKALNDISRKNNSIILLIVENGLVPDSYQRLIRTLSDGIIQLTFSNTESRIDRYINVAKMRGKPPASKLIPFSVDDEGKYIYIDTRERYG